MRMLELAMPDCPCKETVVRTNFALGRTGSTSARPPRQQGFSLIDIMFVVLLFGVLMAVTVPGATTASRRYNLIAANREVAAQVRAARLTAVTSNRTIRVRFNCPVAGQYRVVEVVNNAAIDNAADRCSSTTYPYPDPNPAALPDLDGPVMVLRGGITFGGVQDLDIAPTGRVTPLTGAVPATIGVTNSYETQNLTVSATGRVQVP